MIDDFFSSLIPEDKLNILLESVNFRLSQKRPITLLVCIDHFNQYKWPVFATSVRIMTFSLSAGRM